MMRVKPRTETHTGSEFGTARPSVGRFLALPAAPLRLLPARRPVLIALLLAGVSFAPVGAQLPFGASQAQAQTSARTGGLFSPIVTVNGMAVTGYELDQRMKFMQVLRQSGDLRAAAEKSLIEDRLRMWEAKRQDVTVSEDDIKKGMSDFAARANLTTEQFEDEIAKDGIDPSTFRDFVTAGLAWREMARKQFLPRVRISDADIDRAMLAESERGQGTRVLLSEIIIPAPEEHLAEAEDIAGKVSRLKGEAAFADAAAQVSAANTREKGGRLEWMPLDNLPPALRPVILALNPGQISQPIELNGAIGVFMLRGLDGGGVASTGGQRLSYATMALGADGQNMLARVAADAHSCDDLYTISKDQPGLVTRVGPMDQGQIPRDIAVELAHLDLGETAVIGQGSAQRLVMLCSRQSSAQIAAAKAADEAKAKQAAEAAKSAPQPGSAPNTQGSGSVAGNVNDPASPATAASVYEADKAKAQEREEIRNRLLNQRISTYADNYLADLMADAVIVRP